MRSSAIRRRAMLGALWITALPGCGGGDLCERQCAALIDCAVVTDIDLCTTTCEAMRDGVCESPGCTGTGSAPAACTEALLEHVDAADGRACTPAFTEGWCGTYFGDPLCLPFSLGDVTCR